MDIILVTGATGFVGRCLIDALESNLPKKKIRVYIRKQPEIKLWSNEVDVVTGSLSDTSNIQKATAGVSTIVHLAAALNPDSGDKNKIREVNLSGSKALFIAARDSGCKQFIHISSTSVYGTPQSDKIRSEDSPLKPANFYGTIKLETEKELLSIDSSGIVLNILRPTDIYGAGSIKHIPLFKKIRDQKWAFELPGDIIFNPINVKDVAASILAVISNPAPHKSIFNIGGEELIQQNKYYELIAQKMKTKRRRIVIPKLIAIPASYAASFLSSNPMLKQLARGELQNYGCDTSRFRSKYNFPMTNLDDSIEEFVEWADKNNRLS